MDVSEALARRRMTRSFTGEPIAEGLLVDLCRSALRAPTAGNSRGVEFLVLQGVDEVAGYFAASTDDRWRQRSARYEGLARASAIVLVLADPDAYVERYGEGDKASSGLGAGTKAWPIPYWIGDAGAATMALLLACEERELGCCFLGAFRGADALASELDIPEELLVYGAVLIGRPDGQDHRSASLDRPGKSRASRVHRGRYGGAAQP